jgi:hypothetical protein
MTLFFNSGAATDPIYCRMRDGLEDHDARGREYLERIWQEGAQYVDPDSTQKATRDLVSVFWELQLAYAVKCAGKNLVPRVRLGYRNNKGPDLFADDPGVWLEAVVVRCGTGPDALQYPEMMKAYSYDPDGVVLRLRSVIQDKSKKLQQYIEDGIIKPGHATVIAISGVILPHRFSGIFPPEIVRAVYPANHPVIEIDRTTNVRSDSYIEYRDRVQKHLGAEVATDVFLDPKFAHVSSVIYSAATWVDPSNPPGSDFKIVHNSTACTPLPDGWFPAGTEYWWRDGGRLEFRQHA